MRAEDRERLKPPDSPAALHRELRAGGLESLWQRPGWSPVESIGLLPVAVPGEAALPLGASKFGGDPDLPEDLPWPVGMDATPLSFLAQIALPDIAGLPPAARLPSGGWLWFFADTTEAAGGKLACAVLREDAPVSALRRIPPPVAADSGERLCDSFVAHRMEFHSVYSVPELPPVDLDPEQAEAYWALLNPDAIVHKLLGAPNRIQGPLLKGGKRGARSALLLQLDTDRRLDMSWGDNGRLFVLVPEPDLPSGDYRHGRAQVQSH